VIWLLAAALATFALIPSNARARFAARGSGRLTRLALPGFVESLGAALGAGLSLELALSEIAPTLPRPLDERCRIAAASLRLGAPLETALETFGAGLPGQDLAGLRTVLLSFHRAGGPVRRRLERVAGLLRGRLALEEEHSALTAQGRVSAIVLLALAPFGGALFMVLMPSYSRTLFEKGLGLLALAVAFHAVTRDARGGDRQLRHATGRNVDLEDPPIAHRPILAAGIMATPARPAASGDEEPD